MLIFSIREEEKNVISDGASYIVKYKLIINVIDSMVKIY